MKLFPILNQTLVSQENREAYGSWDARVWPSEASAVRTDQREANIVGKCHRASFGRLMGWPITNKTDVVSARRFVTGRLMEADVIRLAKDAGVFVANGVRVHVQDEETGLSLPLELDLVVIDRETGQLGIGENKTIYGYGAKKVIEGGEPKLEGLMQSLIYLNEFPTGAVLKQVILDCWWRKQELAEQIKEKIAEGADPFSYKSLQREYDRNRVEVDLEQLAKASDGPIFTSMLYETRDDCTDREFEVGVFEDEQGNHWPTVDGIPNKAFTLESIYERYQILQMYHQRAKEEAQRRVAIAGYLEPSENARSGDIWKYKERVMEEMKNLPYEFWPPAEYEWRYDDEKIEMLFQSKLMTKSAYEASQRKKTAKTYKPAGHWACAFCNFKAKCISAEYPEMAHMVADLNSQEDEKEAA
jgi:hypothetical protein